MKASELDHPPRFTARALTRLIGPLVLEQILLVTVGVADSVMVASVGEAAVSGVSLVDQINVLLIQIFAALATGGAVVSSQYLGRREPQNASLAAKQLVWITLALSGTIGLAAVALNRSILQAVFGATEAGVLREAQTYFWISALSYPFIAVYNAGAALFRSMGNSRISLLACFIMNVVNIGGNAILIYGCGMGVAGAATASLVSRAAAAILVLLLLRRPENPVCLRGLLRAVRPQPAMLRSILRVGVPNGIENGMFQIGKLLVMSLVAGMGLAAITANAVANNVASMVNVPGNAVGLAMLTVVGQCVGARDYQQVKYYTNRLLLVSFAGMGCASVLVYTISPWIVGIYEVGAATSALSLQVLHFFCVCTALFWVPSFALPNTLRGAGDARYTMRVSMLSMWICRVLMSYVLVWLGWGLMGIWVAMVLDWLVRDACFLWRYLWGRWQRARVIE